MCSRRLAGLVLFAPEPAKLRCHQSGEAGRIERSDDGKHHVGPDARRINGYILLIDIGRGELGFETMQRLEVVERVKMFVDQLEQARSDFELGEWIDPRKWRSAKSR